jgi:hypothetical protein
VTGSPGAGRPAGGSRGARDAARRGRLRSGARALRAPGGRRPTRKAPRGHGGHRPGRCSPGRRGRRRRGRGSGSRAGWVRSGWTQRHRTRRACSSRPRPTGWRSNRKPRPCRPGPTARAPSPARPPGGRASAARRGTVGRAWGRSGGEEVGDSSFTVCVFIGSGQGEKTVKVCQDDARGRAGCVDSGKPGCGSCRFQESWGRGGPRGEDTG